MSVFTALVFTALLLHRRRGGGNVGDLYEQLTLRLSFRSLVNDSDDDDNYVEAAALCGFNITVLS